MEVKTLLSHLSISSLLLSLLRLIRTPLLHLDGLPRKQTSPYPTSLQYPSTPCPLSPPTHQPSRKQGLGSPAIPQQGLLSHPGSFVCLHHFPHLFKPLCITTALPVPGELSCPQQATDRNQWIITQLLGSVRVGRRDRGWGNSQEIFILS